MHGSLSVGVPRFELGTSRTRTVRSTCLSHTPVYGKRANYTIAMRIRKLWVEQNFLSVHIKNTGNSIVLLMDGQSRGDRLGNLVWDGRLE